MAPLAIAGPEVQVVSAAAQVKVARRTTRMELVGAVGSADSAAKAVLVVTPPRCLLPAREAREVLVVPEAVVVKAVPKKMAARPKPAAKEGRAVTAVQVTPSKKAPMAAWVERVV
jgi:hypothetical protein